MNHRHTAGLRRIGAALGLSVALALAGSGGAVASESSGDADVVSQVVSRQGQADAATYWTPDRMRSAVSGDRLLEGRSLADFTGEVTRGVARIISGTTARAPQLLDLGGLLSGGGGALYDGGGKVVQTTGKVFFTLGGTNYVCSGSSVVAANKSLVQTAGHCLNEGPGGFATNFVFVPAYRDGDAPYGQFSARSLHTTAQWSGEGDLNYDVGFAVVNPAGGAALADAVGSQGVGFNLARGATMHAFGYPAASPYDGSKLAWCKGKVANDPLGSDDQGLRCNMTGGSSGGPWFINYDEASGIGTLNSVNSFKYTLPLLDSRMYGPYFGSVIEDLYQTAQGS